MALAGVLPAETPNIRTTVRLVVAPVTVTDAHGAYLDGLTEKDFRLRDNGQPRNIHVDVAFTPISLVVAVQRSSFSAEALNKTRKIGGMLEPLVTGERGEVAVVAFDSLVEVRQELTSDFDKVDKALSRLQPGDDGGRLIDAVAESVHLLASRPSNRRRVLLLISETRDRGSRTKIEDVVTLAEQQNVTVYALTYSAYSTAFTAKAGTLPPADGAGVNLIAIFREITHLAKTNAAEALSRYTGGRRLAFTRQKSLEEAVERIGEELHSQYILSFQVPGEPDDAYHSIEVAVPAWPGSRVRTRPGYWMTTAQP
jgi:VWFA-related protein